MAALVGTATVQIYLCINSKIALRCGRLCGALHAAGREFQPGYVRCCLMGYSVTGTKLPATAWPVCLVEPALA